MPAAILVDFHAEASSEKMALGHFADGRVSAVFGSHCHVPTADNQIFPGGTAYQTDAGMCGDYDSVIGMQKGPAVRNSSPRCPASARKSPRAKRRCAASCSRPTTKPVWPCRSSRSASAAGSPRTCRSAENFDLPAPSLFRDRLFPGGLGNVVQAFAHRNYRIYASGNAVSLIGVWMQRVAVGWLAWTLTHSGAWLGIISMAEFFPVVFLSPLAGALADRRDRVGIIRVTQIAGSIEATLLAVLVYTGAITIELLFALTLLLGVFNAVAQPSRLALIPTLVDRAALPSALAINAIIFNSARFLGPAVAGIVIAKVSVGAAFAVNAATYIVFLVAMTNLRGIPALPVAATQSVLKASAEAYGYASRHPGIAPMLLLFTVTTVGTRGFVELFPGFADSVFGRGPEGLATLTSTVGLGAIFGAGWMLLRPAIAGLTRSCSATP